MTRMAVLTKSYAPDFELCAALNRSILENSPETVHHNIIAPRSDLELFGRLAGPRTSVRDDTAFLPSTFVRVPFCNIMVNLKSPWPPVRGWIQQQVLKLAGVAASNEDAVLVADSDVEFIRPFSAETFVRDGAVRFFRGPKNIDRRLPRHMTWHRIARELLGLPAEEPPYPDYISSPLAWDPAIVRRMLARVAATTGRPWHTAIAGQLDFSECVLYGVFVDSLINSPANSFVCEDSLCHVYWDNKPLHLEGSAQFVGSIRPTDIAAVIQSKSRTPPAVREAIFAALRASQAHQPQPGLPEKAR